MDFKPSCAATAIGSMPHEDPDAACQIILNSIPEIPIWPQLPNIDFRENMEIQYSEGLPCAFLDTEKKSLYFETEQDITTAFEQFYENYMTENLAHFAITPEYSRGIPATERLLKDNKPSDLKLFKGHITGPITIGLGRTDENKRAIYYNDMFRDILVKGSEMKARWMLDKFKFLECPQICFIDEPILSGFGSSTYVSVQRQDVVTHLNEVIGAIHKHEALAGIHCCGNTEWTILIDAGVDIISFDAYDFGMTIAYYPGPVKEFLEDGGSLAWGIVPTSERITEETPDSLVKKLEETVDNLASKGINRSLIWDQCLITPSCGTGSLRVDLADKIFETLGALSRLLRG
ncbi:hypothetical protein ACFLT9_04655 [Acidobacteriota bacterium]